MTWRCPSIICLSDKGNKPIFLKPHNKTCIYKIAKLSYRPTGVRVHCTFRKLSGVVLCVGIGTVLGRCVTIDGFVRAFKDAILTGSTTVGAVTEGSVCFTVQAETSLALEDLHKRYSTGRLQRDLQEFLVTDEIRQLADGEEVEVRVDINEKEFREAHDDLINVDQEGNLA